MLGRASVRKRRRRSWGSVPQLFCVPPHRAVVRFSPNLRLWASHVCATPGSETSWDPLPALIRSAFLVPSSMLMCRLSQYHTLKSMSITCYHETIMIYPTFKEEKKLWKKGYRSVVGIDEVGRGPLAGPVVACALVFLSKPGKRNLIKKKMNKNLPRLNFAGLRDSKRLSAKQ